MSRQEDFGIELDEILHRLGDDPVAAIGEMITANNCVQGDSITHDLNGTLRGIDDSSVRAAGEDDKSLTYRDRCQQQFLQPL